MTIGVNVGYHLGKSWDANRLSHLWYTPENRRKELSLISTHEYSKLEELSILIPGSCFFRDPYDHLIIINLPNR